MRDAPTSRAETRKQRVCRSRRPLLTLAAWLAIQELSGQAPGGTQDAHRLSGHQFRRYGSGWRALREIPAQAVNRALKWRQDVWIELKGVNGLRRHLHTHVRGGTQAHQHQFSCRQTCLTLAYHGHGRWRSVIDSQASVLDASGGARWSRASPSRRPSRWRPGGATSSDARSNPRHSVGAVNRCWGSRKGPLGDVHRCSLYSDIVAASSIIEASRTWRGLSCGPSRQSSLPLGVCIGGAHRQRQVRDTGGLRRGWHATGGLDRSGTCSRKP